MKSTADFDEITVFGSRGTTLMILRHLTKYWRGRVKIRALIDDMAPAGMHPDLGLPIISSADRLRSFPDLPVLVTPASPRLRAKVVAQLDAEGATLATVVCSAPGHVNPSASYGPGSVCLDAYRIGPNVSIGAGAQVMAALVAHDVTIGACSNLGIHSSVLGHVIVSDGVNIAPFAVISNGTAKRPLRIGRGAVVGVGAVVVRDVPDGARVFGNPAMTDRRWVKLNRLLDDE